MVKLFAKRTKKATGTAITPTVVGEGRDGLLSEADKKVMELLGKDPTTLNAKERRMVKRYQERNNSSVDQKGETVKGIDSSKIARNEDRKSPRKDPSPTASTRDLESTAALSSVEDANEVSAESVELRASTEEPELVTAFGNEKGAELRKADGQTELTLTGNDKEDPETSAAMSSTRTVEEIDVLKTKMEKLNSKQRRTLSRRLDREGLAALESVRNEVEELLGAAARKDATASTKEAAPKDEGHSTSIGNNSNKGKKRKRAADWSTLPPAERFRREEQRRMQKEAEERRKQEEANGGASSKHKHPLNSERRRANRRKPKWDGGQRSKGGSVDHNTSGFYHRKVTTAASRG